MSLPNKKLVYSIVAPLAPALAPILLASLWATASLIAESNSVDNDGQDKQQETLLVQSGAPTINGDGLISQKNHGSSATKQATVATVSAVPKATPSPNVTINLINQIGRASCR